MNNLTNLLSCPFCGSMPKVENGFAPMESIDYAICINQECPLSQEALFTPEEWNRRQPDAHAQIDALKAELAEAKKDIQRIDSVQPEASKGTERWERLAWALCAEENGEDACTELIWEGAPNPEPWGDLWLKYEGEAKRMIELVDKYASAELQDTKEKQE